MPLSGLISGGASGLGSTGDLLTGGVSQLITGGINSMFQGIAQRRQYKNQKKLMKMAHEYELENLAEQDKYQRGLVRDAASMTKTGLENAGYSTADPNGTGVSPVSVSAPSTSATGSAGSFPIDAGSVGQGISALMSGQLASSQARLNEIEAKYRAKKLEGEIGKLNVEIDTAKEKLPFIADTAKANIANIASQAHLNEKQLGQISASIDKLKAETENISIDNKFRPDISAREVKKLDAEVTKLAAEGKLKAVEAKLADYGILVGADWFTTLAAMSLQGHGDEFVGSVSSLISEIAGALPSAIGSLIGSIGTAIIGSPDGVKAGMVKGAEKAGAALGSALGKPIGAAARGFGLKK